MCKTAFIFPGQGAQKPGMGKDFYDNFQQSKEIYERASKAAGLDMAKLCFEENKNLDITEYTQAAILTTSIAMLEAFKSFGIRADVCAGLSLGEYAALTACGVIGFDEAAYVVRQRGILMQEAVPVGTGAMAAVLAVEKEIIERVISPIEGVEIANYNCPGQIVISGKKEAVEEASLRLKKAGAKRCVPLNVSGPFHSSMLKKAGEELYEVLLPVELKNPEIPYVTNVTAEYVTEAEHIKELLKRQVYSSVKWMQSVEAMIKDGVDTFIEIGPGKTLSGFVKKINKDVSVFNIEKTEDMERVAEAAAQA